MVAHTAETASAAFETFVNWLVSRIGAVSAELEFAAVLNLFGTLEVSAPTPTQQCCWRYAQSTRRSHLAEQE